MNSVVEPLWDDLLGWLEEGGSVLGWCLKDATRPNRRTIYRFAESTPERSSQFARARERGAETRWENAEEILRGTAGLSTGDSFRDKLLAEHQYKTAACFRPQRYGAKAIAGQIAAAQDGATTTIQIVTGVPAPDSDAAKEG